MKSLSDDNDVLNLFGAENEQGNTGFVSDLRDGATVKNIAKKTVTMAGHGDQITLFLDGYL